MHGFGGESRVFSDHVELTLTARGYRCVMRVARPLADLDGAYRVGRPDVAEALSYRRIAPGR